MENNKNKKSVKFQGDMLNFCDFIQVFVFTPNHHLKQACIQLPKKANTLICTCFKQADFDYPSRACLIQAGLYQPYVRMCINN